MKALIIGPLPPPMTGNALPVKVLCDDLLQKGWSLDIINLSKQAHRAGVDSVRRVIEVLYILIQVWRKWRTADVIYLTVAESFAGNLRDLFIYLICRRRLDRLVIHMLGGARMASILGTSKGLRFRLNRYFLSRVAGIVVEGNTQKATFSQVTSPSRIHVIQNFAEDFLFHSENEVLDKFNATDPLRVLFLSNMLEGKGHIELLEAYRRLPPRIQDRIWVDFAGKLVSRREYFLELVGATNHVTYHGPVFGVRKRDLYQQSHIFCLPTYYPYEGQPFCIIEAYATACVVVTTSHSGIRNVFTNEVNGFEVQKKSVDALASLLEKLLEQVDSLRAIGYENLRLAKNKHTRLRYLEEMNGVLSSVVEGKDPVMYPRRGTSGSGCHPVRRNADCEAA